MGLAGNTLRAYTDAVQEELLVDADRADESKFAVERAGELPAEARDLLDALLLAGDAGEPVDALWASRIEKQGGLLWRHGFLLPRSPPTRGSRIDPKWYAASARLNRALRRRRPFQEALEAPEHRASMPPSRSIWDAVVVAAELERNPRRLTKDGLLRKDERVRLLETLGEPERWDLALRHAWSTGLARPAGDKLTGFPEAHPRRLVDPTSVLTDEFGPAARLLLRASGDDWVNLDLLQELLRERAPKLPWSGLHGAANALHRMEVLDGSMGVDGLVAVRRPGERPEFPQGFMLTPDLDILVAQGEMPLNAYGRLCRMAPYGGGDRVHRHKLSRDGVAGDLAVGHENPEDWLAGFSRTGVPSSVRQSLKEWARAAERITLSTGALVLEHADGSLHRIDAIPEGVRVIDYGTEKAPPARFAMVGDELQVPVGEDALSVRSALLQVAEPLGRDDDAWHFRLAPRKTADVAAVLESLRRLHADQLLPGELEASVLAAHGLEPATTERALLIHLPLLAADAIRRDRIAGPMLERQVTETQCLVTESDVPLLRARLAELGIELR